MRYIFSTYWSLWLLSCRTNQRTDKEQNVEKLFHRETQCGRILHHTLHIWHVFVHESHLTAGKQHFAWVLALQWVSVWRREEAKINLSDSSSSRKEKKTQKLLLLKRNPECGPLETCGLPAQAACESLVDHNDHRWPLARCEVSSGGPRPRSAAEMYTALLWQPQVWCASNEPPGKFWRFDKTSPL